jgi:hypothetical protein
VLSTIFRILSLLLKLFDVGVQVAYLYKKVNREKRLEILKDKTKSVDERLTALRDLER